MKTPINIGGNDLIEFLQVSQAFIMADLFTVTLKNGTVLRYTDWEMPLTISYGAPLVTESYLAGPPNFERGAISETVGFEVATMEFTVAAWPTDLIYGVPILQTIARGDWDQALVQVKRLYLDPALQPIGMFVRFLGQLGELDEVTRTEAKFTAKAMTELLNMKLPKNLIQPGCFHTLFDAGCTLSKASFGASSSVEAGSNVIKILCSLTQATGYFDQGTLTFTSGPNNGLSCTVRSYVHGSPSELRVTRALLAPPNAGDGFMVYPGCDKTQATCSGKFSNLANFGGFPYVPAPETAL